ncbi:MAG: EamA family transporter [Saccharospirillum sp.]|uniref:EamA family transporter n=1 Tax=Saccharospirillum sp. TaxID=2033801 RepID=UPI003299EFDE
MAVLWSLLSAMMFAGTFILVKLGRRTVTTLATLWITLSFNVAILWPWSLALQPVEFSQWWDWRYFVLAGLFAPLLGRLFQFIGMARLGANITTPITLTHPLVTVVVAVLLLSEPVTLTKLLGGVLVLVGSLAVGSQGLSPSALTTVLGERQRRYLWFPVAASVAYGISVVFRKIGIDLGTDAVTASAVTTTASWLVVTVFVSLRWQWQDIRCTAFELKYLAAAGLLSSLGPVFFYLALQKGELIVVAPLAATTPLFVLLATWLLSREGELFSRTVLTGTVVTVIGVSLMTAF